ncbi:hypothetical protein CR513_31780, partial [Mucuna pruriens]
MRGGTTQRKKKEGSKSIEAYHRDMEVTLLKANVLESNEATMGHIASQCPNKRSMILQKDKTIDSESSRDESSSTNKTNSVEGYPQTSITKGGEQRLVENEDEEGKRKKEQKEKERKEKNDDKKKPKKDRASKGIECPKGPKLPKGPKGSKKKESVEGKKIMMVLTKYWGASKKYSPRTSHKDYLPLKHRIDYIMGD